MPTAGRPSCLANTRLDVIEFITAWITSEDQNKPVLWLSGLSGTGKSTISTTIANILRELRRLGAFVFFNRDVKERHDPMQVIRTLAYKLACFDTRIGDAVSAAIESTSDIAESPLAFQFRTLLHGPLSSLESLHSGGPIVIVIDALDECGSAKGRKELMTALLEGVGGLPSFVRILVTSRPERDIETAFRTNPFVHRCELDLTSESTANDIRVFVETQMAMIRANNSTLGLSPGWPGQDNVTALVRHAQGLFVWASTACAFIEEGHDPRLRLAPLITITVSSTPLKALDALYETALRSAGSWNDEAFRSDCLSILGLILVVKIPISCNAMDDLLNCGLPQGLPRPSLHTLSCLGSVLRLSETDPIRILHPSFQDFLSDRVRCGNNAWFVELNRHHGDLAICCIGLLEQKLKKNICDLRIGEAFSDRPLSESLSYACIYWVEHIISATEVSMDRIYTLLSQHLLHWMEVMSILKLFRVAIRELQRLREWIELVMAPVDLFLS